MARVFRVITSFVAVLTAYWAYALAVVPMIEPTADMNRSEGPDAQRLEMGENAVQRQLRQFDGLFPPGSWELSSSKILESEQFTLLLGDYKNRGDGKVEIHPCTMVFMAAGLKDTQAERRRRAIVLQAPKGALLEFDSPLDLKQAKIGRLVGGRLLGQVTIRSDGKLPGPEDDLRIDTRDVEITERRVWTPYQVAFRLGPNNGCGEEMTIRLSPAASDDSIAEHGPNIGGVESFELQRLDRLHLELADGDLFSGGKENAAKKPPSGGIDKPAPRPVARETVARKTVSPAADTLEGRLPVEVTCRGPFRFDFVEQVATFQREVDVLQLHPDGPSDQLSCELLSVFFGRRRPATPSPDDGADDKADGKHGHKPGHKPRHKPANPLALEARRVEAHGTPVIVRSPSREIHIRGRQMAYDVLSGEISLDDDREIVLIQGPNELHARSVVYTPVPGHLGKIVAEGPGWLRGRLSEKKGQQMATLWTGQLQVRPDQDEQMVSVIGGAQVQLRGLGKLDAQQIHLWLAESNAAKKAPSPKDASQRSQADRLRPVRMCAQHDVQVASPQLSGRVDRMDIWFDDQTGGQTGAGQDQRAGAATGAEGHGSADDPPNSQATGADPLPPPAGEAPPRHFFVSGGALQAQMVLRDETTELAALVIERNVEFRETRTEQPDDRPLRVSGDRVQVTGADKTGGGITVTGRVAHFEGRGLALTGTNISLNRGTNQLWMDGPGRLELIVNRDLQGRPTATERSLSILWQERMLFDGQAAKFESGVVATTAQQRLDTESLEVVFSRPIQFAEEQFPSSAAQVSPGQVSPAQPPPDVRRILCRGGVAMVSRSTGQEESDPRQDLDSIERMEAENLTIDRLTGELTAVGPGWVTTVRRGGSEGFALGGTDLFAPAGGASPSVPASTASDDSLSYLRVGFQKSITGNLHQRQMAFVHQVRCVYGPVDRWEQTLDANNPDGLPTDGLVLTCDRLNVVELDAPASGKPTRELEAVGNTVVEGQSFTARAHRMTYTEAKDLLMLEGDGRADAALFRQPQRGGPTSEVFARQILYWRTLNRVKVNGARSMQMSQPPGR